MNSVGIALRVAHTSSRKVAVALLDLVDDGIQQTVECFSDGRLVTGNRGLNSPHQVIYFDCHRGLVLLNGRCSIRNKLCRDFGNTCSKVRCLCHNTVYQLLNECGARFFHLVESICEQIKESRLRVERVQRIAEIRQSTSVHILGIKLLENPNQTVQIINSLSHAVKVDTIDIVSKCL